ncbi:MAG TPA: hypothetical protein PKK10_03385 [Woeseiaceae bacterium]|nr:hypothetical protein [Woeseiaceae bacterium]
MAYHGKYDSPADVLRDESLSHREKIAMLESWRDDKEAYMRASEEGMQGDDRSDLLQLIEKALSTLQENPAAQ